jgi:hypothetical protein
MKKWSIYSIVATLTALMLNNINAQSVTLLKTEYLENYPSASGVEYNDGKLYVIGDDATQLLVLSTNYTPIDSIMIYQQSGKRINYTIKPDLESLTFSRYKGNDYLIATPSYSSEKRNTLYIFPLNKLSKYKTISTLSPSQHLKNIGISEPNIEGSAIIKKKVVISNRANFTNPVNYLVNIPLKKHSLKKCNSWKKSAVIFPNIESTIGISGLEYWAKIDLLIFTASTEITTSANADGAIGESFLGYFKGYSQQLSHETVTPDKLINLSKELKIGNQKIEGVCIESHIGNTFILHLVADNDDGRSTLYKVQLTL